MKVDSHSLDEDGNINVIKFQETSLKISGMTTKSISEPKIQETPTIQILRCVRDSKRKNNCRQDKKSMMDNKIEMNKRFGMPIYIPLIALVCCFLLRSRKDEKIFNFKKYIYFLASVLILTFAEIIVRYSGISWTHSIFYYLIPILLLPIFYLTLIKTFKYENLS